MIEEVVFGNTVISDFWPVVDVSRTPIPGRSNTTRDVSGMDGNIITGSVMQPIRISMQLIIGDGDVAYRRAEMRRIAAALHTDQPEFLSVSSDNGLYYRAMLDGQAAIKEHVRADRLTVNFVTESPAMYGVERRITVPSGQSITFEYDGTYPARPVIVASYAFGASSSTYWGLKLDDKDFIRVKTGSSSSYRLVRIDCDTRTAYVSGALSLPTLDSDWLEFTHGSHTIRNDVGTGDAQVIWDERWI